jgi:hypothetical protein
MGSVVSGASSGEVQRIAENFGAFHDLYLAGNSPLLARIPRHCSCLRFRPIVFGAPGIARQVTITEAVWVGTTWQSAGDYEVNWVGPV